MQRVALNPTTLAAIMVVRVRPIPVRCLTIMMTQLCVFQWIVIRFRVGAVIDRRSTGLKNGNRGIGRRSGSVEVPVGT